LAFFLHLCRDSSHSVTTVPLHRSSITIIMNFLILPIRE
jgi:hypothetical protein